MAHKQTPQQKALLQWYRKEKRDLPWRHTTDPYRIAISEVMLQQTQVDRVIPFYERFLATLPTTADLAQADDATIHRLWKGLGYPSRVERLRAACQQIQQQLNGCWPQTLEGLAALPGFGPYTSAAVACFAFGLPVPLVDTNVARVYARRDGLAQPLDKKALWHHAEQELAAKQCVAYNNALMELGAVICQAKKTNCSICPWQSWCVSQADEAALVASANPLKVASTKKQYGQRIARKKNQKSIALVLALIHWDGRYLAALRPQGVHQAGKWELPGGKRESGEDDRTALAREIQEELGVELLAARPFVRFDHQYDDTVFRFQVYRCRVFHPEQVTSHASDRLQWCEPKAFLALDFPPANQPILDRLRDYHRLTTATTP